MIITLRRYKRDTGHYSQDKDQVRARASATACALRSIPETNVSRTMAMGIDDQAHQHHDFVLFSLFVYLATGAPSSNTACVHIDGALKQHIKHYLRKRWEIRKINRNFAIYYCTFRFLFATWHHGSLTTEVLGFPASGAPAFDRDDASSIWRRMTCSARLH